MINDTSFKSAYLSTYYFETLRIIKPLMPPQEQSVYDIPKINGVLAGSKKFKSNSITVRGIIYGTDPENLITRLSNLASFLYSDADQPLIFNNQSAQYYNAQYLDTQEILREISFSMIDLIFTCNDPLAYAITPTVDLTNITIIDTFYVINNGGHYYSFPLISVVFNAIQNHIYIQNTSVADNRIDISKSFEIGDTLEIDCKKRTVKLNGAYSPAGFGEGGLGFAEWIILAAGNNIMQVGSEDMAIDVSVTISFEKVYLY